MKRLLISALLVSSSLAFAQTSSTGGKIELEGRVQSMPEQGPKGEWKVSGLTVTVGERTVVKEEEGKLAVGKKVEIEGILEEDGKITATEIETEQD